MEKMPRGRHENHKGRSRQFTPVDLLQQELEEGLKIARSQVCISKSPTDGNDDSSSENEEENTVSGGGVHRLIEISNPNRPPDPNALRRMALQKLNEVPVPLRDRTGQLNRRERECKQSRAANEQKTIQVKSDLARLALIRQEREAAAKKRMALASKSKKMLTNKCSDTKENNPNAGNENTKNTEIKRNSRFNQNQLISK